MSSSKPPPRLVLQRGSRPPSLRRATPGAATPTPPSPSTSITISPAASRQSPVKPLRRVRAISEVAREDVIVTATPSRQASLDEGPSTSSGQHEPILHSASSSHNPTTTTRAPEAPRTERTPLLLVHHQHASFSRSHRSSRPSSPGALPSPLSPSFSSSNAPKGSSKSNNKKKDKGKLRSRLLVGLVGALLLLCIYASFQNSFLDDVEAGIICGTCLVGVMAPLKALAHIGDDVFVAVLVGFCTDLGIEDPDVCRGAITQQAPILAHDLRSISLASHTARTFCSTVFGMCPLAEVREVQVALLAKEPPLTLPVEVQKAKEKKPPLKVVHISDVHIDRDYVVGSDAICSKVLCCREYESTKYPAKEPAGQFGNRHCDTPKELIDSMVDYINTIEPSRDFTIFTGDVVEAAVWLVDQKEVESDLSGWHAQLAMDGKGVAYPALGNHDVAPVNSFPRHSTLLSLGRGTGSNSTFRMPGSITNDSSSQWVFDGVAKDWEKWIGPKAAKMVKEKSGCYSVVHPGTNLRVISINTQYWYKQNCETVWLYDSDEPQWDPNGLLRWLASELHAAETLGQRAWIVGHMSFGKPDCLRDQSNYATQIFDRYAATIAAQFYGHSHVDEFEIGYTDYRARSAQTASGISFIGGAVTPQSGNPVFRVYDVDPETYEVLDFTIYIANRTEPGYQDSPRWFKYYSARESYGPLVTPPLEPHEALGPSFWHRLTEAMEADDSLFQLFNRRLSRGGKVERCRTVRCKADTICMLRSMRSQDNCIELQVGLSFKDRKRDTEAVTEPNTDQDQKDHESGAPKDGGDVPSSPPKEEEDDEDEHEEEEDFYALANRRMHDFSCEGPGLGSLLREIGTRLGRGDAHVHKAFREAVDVPAAEALRVELAMQQQPMQRKWPLWLGSSRGKSMRKDKIRWRETDSFLEL